MKKLVFPVCCLFISLMAFSNTIIVRNIEELKKANQHAQPGDTIVLQNGEWNNVIIALNCRGTKERPIVFKAQSSGKVLVTGHSQLKLGGTFIVVDGLLFINGFGGDEVINFRIDKSQLANNCRVTNCVINDFNNPKRLNENHWVAFYGKNNRLDHCSFLNKKNIGVLLAVILDDDRSRENFHSIDHNFFGIRLPLASNGGEIIRVGVSEHCQFNSNTQITDNFFEHCDGETEVVSIKSCENVIRNNFFKECQGGVVLRHGNYNIVENNVFLGNDKEGTGGVRVINKGQWIINNFFYRCRGIDFRSPLSIMNGIPNSPANRYVQVTDAVIANNTWFNCTPVSFCEGSDTERTLAPQNVYLVNNAFYNNKDNNIYKTFDAIDGFTFAGNDISKEIKQETVGGFRKTTFGTQKMDNIPLPIPSGSHYKINDSLQQESEKKLSHSLSGRPGFSDLSLLKKISANAYSSCGAKWYNKNKGTEVTKSVSCRTTEEIRNALSNTKSDKLIIDLTAKSYQMYDPMPINRHVEIIASGKQKIRFQWRKGNLTQPILFEIKGGNTFKLTGLDLDLAEADDASHGFSSFIRTDTSGTSNHVNLVVRNCIFRNLFAGDGAFFRASKSVVCDSIVVKNCRFENNYCQLLDFSNETDNKGYYNVEKLVFTDNVIVNHMGAVLHMLRGGNDESTMGPKLIFTGNKLQDCKNGIYNNGNMISLVGTQVSYIKNNQFARCYADSGNVIEYKDFVRAAHVLSGNKLVQSGGIVSDKFVQSENNTVQ